MEDVFVEMSASCFEYQENAEVQIQCASCKTLLKLDSNPVLKCENNKGNESLSLLLRRSMEKNISNSCCMDLKSSFELH